MAGFSAATRQLIADRSCDYEGFVACEVWAHCQGARAVAVHHRRPRQAGGSRRPDTNMPANGLAVCDADHVWIESHRDLARNCGWLLQQSDVPSCMPVLRRGVWVLLNDAGGFVRVPAPSATR